MAIYHLNAKIISRGKGQSAIAAAAYRSGERLVDETSGEVKAYKLRAARILHSEIIIPDGAPEWALSRSHLWNRAEQAERRRDAQLAREVEISLPHELSSTQRVELARQFAREAFVENGFAIDLSIHAPDKESDRRNHHVHILVTRRTLGPEGFASAKDWRFRRDMLANLREHWSKVANRHLEIHGHCERIDHRSLASRGLNHEPTIHLGVKAKEMALRGSFSARVEELSQIHERNRLRAALDEVGDALAQANSHAEIKIGPALAAEAPQSPENDGFLVELSPLDQPSNERLPIHTPDWQRNGKRDDHDPHGRQRLAERTAETRDAAADHKTSIVGNPGTATSRGTIGAEAVSGGERTAQILGTEHPYPLSSGNPQISSKRMIVLDEQTLARQAEREGRRLRDLQQIEERAWAFRRAREQEAEEAKRKQSENVRTAEVGEASDGDISNAQARYAIALGENYSIRDPYGSLARAAMAESAVFHRGQETLRTAAAAEQDPAKRRVIELRRMIEAHDYMAITSERLAGISTVITGRADCEQAVADQSQAKRHRELAAGLRMERSELIEAGQQRLPLASPRIPEHSASIEPASKASENSATPAPAAHAAEQSRAPEPAHNPASDRTQVADHDRDEPSPDIYLHDIRRPDTFKAPSVSPYVTLGQDDTATPSFAEDSPCVDRLRERFGHESEPAADKELSDNALARLARRMEHGQDQDLGLEVKGGLQPGGDGPEA